MRVEGLCCRMLPQLSYAQLLDLLLINLFIILLVQIANKMG
jgi:hypothetical protein